MDARLRLALALTIAVTLAFGCTPEGGTSGVSNGTGGSADTDAISTGRDGGGTPIADLGNEPLPDLGVAPVSDVGTEPGVDLGTPPRPD